VCGRASKKIKRIIKIKHMSNNVKYDVGRELIDQQKQPKDYSGDGSSRLAQKLTRRTGSGTYRSLSRPKKTNSTSRPR
jgi:hypothetical protein